MRENSVKETGKDNTRAVQPNSNVAMLRRMKFLANRRRERFPQNGNRVRGHCTRIAGKPPFPGTQVFLIAPGT